LATSWCHYQGMNKWERVQKSYSLNPIKPWTPEKIFFNCFTTNQMQDKTTKDNHQHGLVTTGHKTVSWLFLPQLIFNYTIFRYWNCSFSISAYVKQWIHINDILQKSNVESSRQDQTQLDSTSESRKIVSPSQFLFSVYSVVNYMGSYFWDLALFLFEQKVKQKSFT